MSDNMQVETPVPRSGGAIRGKNAALQMLLANSSHYNQGNNNSSGKNAHKGCQYSPRNPSPLAVAIFDDDDRGLERDENGNGNENNEHLVNSTLRKSISVDGHTLIGNGTMKLDMISSSEPRSVSNGTIVSDTSGAAEMSGETICNDDDDDDDSVEISTQVMKPLIPLYVHGDHVLVFDSKDMKTLSVKYGITGQLAGTLPLAPQQNSLLGFPWRLSLYEVIWLVEKEKICVLVDSQDSILKQYLEHEWLENEEMQNDLSLQLQSQLDLWRDEKQREIEEQMKKLNIVKKERKVMKPLDNLKLTSSASMSDLQQAINDKNKEEQSKRELKQKQREIHEKSKRNKIVFMETPTCDNKEKLKPYIKRDNHTQTQLLQRLIDIESGDDASHKQKISQNVQMYTYLKTLGHSLLPGMRFGGTFVSYPGDPLRYHAHQIVETADYYNEDIRLFRLCNRGRLATGVRKVWVIGGTKEEKFDADSVELFSTNQIPAKKESTMCCFSIEWAGF